MQLSHVKAKDRQRASRRGRRVAETFKKLKEQIEAEAMAPGREIAAKLGVTRQTAYEYLRGQTIPGPYRLGKLLETWNLTFKSCGYPVDKGKMRALYWNSTVSNSRL